MSSQKENEPLRFEVVVGNIGMVYQGNDLIQASRVYSLYREKSLRQEGRGAGEEVALFSDGELIRTYLPPPEDARQSIPLQLGEIDMILSGLEILSPDTIEAREECQKLIQRFIALQMKFKRGTRI